MSRKAVFLDRDGTIIVDANYLEDPERVVLLDRAAEALQKLIAAQYAIVVVTNQSGVGRGYFRWEDYQAVAARFEEILGSRGVTIDATYVCPHAPDPAAPCDCRKPGLGLFLEAAADLDLDFRRSWWIGDKLSDILPARALGGAGILVLTGEGPAHADQARQLGFAVATDLWSAAERVLTSREPA